MAQSAFPLLIIIIAGSFAALQALLNSALGQGLGSGTAAAAVSCGVSFLGLMIVLIATGDLATLQRTGGVNRWLLIGGLFGAFYVWAILWTVPVLGLLTAVSAMILGQLVVALILDAFGPLGLSTMTITPQRVAAVFLVAGGLILSKL